ELEFARLYRDHDRLLDRAGAIDSGEMILRAIKLLEERPAMRERVTEHFEAVLVDEYQDTNLAQNELLRLLVERRRNVVGVGDDPASCAVLVRSVRNEGQLVATALEERGIPYRLVGAAAFFERAEVRDLLAWLRLLSDPNDANAVVRALLRPPVELSPVDLARATLIARRRKSDMISALDAALQSPEVPPEARERMETFLRLYR